MSEGKFLTRGAFDDITSLFVRTAREGTEDGVLAKLDEIYDGLPDGRPAMTEGERSQERKRYDQAFRREVERREDW